MNEPLITFRIQKIIRETAEAITLVLEPLNEVSIPYKAGQFLTLLIDRNGKELRRSYSLSSSPGIDEGMMITIKRVVNGEVSRYLMDLLQEGDVIRSLPPAGRFTIETTTDARRDIFLIGAGSGITPLFSLLKYLLKAEPQSHITLINAQRNENTAIFWQPIQQVAQQYPQQFTAITLFSDPTPATVHLRGHLNLGLLEQLVGAHLQHHRSEALFYLCGPSDFMRMARMALIYQQFTGDQIRQEYFVMETLAPVAAGREKASFTAQVTILWKDQTYHFPVQSNEYILRAALERGIGLPYSCQGGRCSTCAGICREGKVTMTLNDVLTDRDVAAGWILTCTSHPASDRVVIEIP